MIDQPSTGSEVTQDDKNMAMLASILGIFTWFVGPLIIFLIKKDQSKYAAFYALQVLILTGALWVVGFGVAHIPIIGLILLLVWPVFWVISLIFCVMAAMAANKGEMYEIPIAGKFARQQTGL